MIFTNRIYFNRSAALNSSFTIPPFSPSPPLTHYLPSTCRVIFLVYSSHPPLNPSLPPSSASPLLYFSCPPHIPALLVSLTPPLPLLLYSRGDADGDLHLVLITLIVTLIIPAFRCFLSSRSRTKSLRFRDLKINEKVKMVKNKQCKHID